MAVSEAVLRAVVTAALAALATSPDWLAEALWELPQPQYDEVAAFLTATPLHVADGWPQQIPASPVIAILPGESEESSQWAGSGIGGPPDAFQTGPWTGVEYSAEGTFFSTTHHIGVWGQNALLVTAVAAALLWSLLAARHLLEDGYGWSQQRAIVGPLGEDQEFSQDGTPVFSRQLHLIFTWQFIHRTTLPGPLLTYVTTTIAPLPGYPG